MTAVKEKDCIQISLEDMEEWDYAKEHYFCTHLYATQFVSLTNNIFENQVEFYFSPTYIPFEKLYERFLTQENAPNTYPLIKEMFSLTKDNAPPPFAFIDLFLEAMEADGDMSFHEYLEGKSQ